MKNIRLTIISQLYRLNPMTLHALAKLTRFSLNSIRIRMHQLELEGLIQKQRQKIGNKNRFIYSLRKVG